MRTGTRRMAGSFLPAWMVAAGILPSCSTGTSVYVAGMVGHAYPGTPRHPDTPGNSTMRGAGLILRVMFELPFFLLQHP